MVMGERLGSQQQLATQPPADENGWMLKSSRMELIFEIQDAEEGGYCARAVGHAIFTEAETWQELRANVLEAVALHFEDSASRPRLVQMHYTRDELIPAAFGRPFVLIL